MTFLDNDAVFVAVLFVGAVLVSIIGAVVGWRLSRDTKKADPEPRDPHDMGGGTWEVS